MKKLKSTLLASAVSTLFVLSCPSISGAATLVDTGTPACGSCGGWVLDSGQWLASKFTLSAATSLTDLEGYVASNGGTFHVDIYSDGGSVPGSLLLYSSVATATTSGSGSNWDGVHGVSWALSAGDYFIGFDVRGGDTYSGFMSNPAPSPLGVDAFTSDSGGTWNGPANLDIGVRIFDNNTGALPVPEPETYAMLLAGLGLLGVVARRRKQATA